MRYYAWCEKSETEIGEGRIMIELKDDQLVFSFPDVHRLATLNVNFQRTLRIPDDDKTYPLPPGLGNFPIAHVDDYRERVPDTWLKHGGVIMPMYQAEALWIRFYPEYDCNRDSGYPFAIKVSTGKIDAVTGAAYNNGLHRNPQDYMVAPGQPWLDGYCVKKGIIRQFVAMPLGEGYTAEEQITKKAEHGGLQIVVYPMKGDVYDRRYPHIENRGAQWGGGASAGGWGAAPGSWGAAPFGGGGTSGGGRPAGSWGAASGGSPMAESVRQEMGLAPGGRMKQEIYRDNFDINDWDTEHSSRCFIHLANSLTWHEITGRYPPHIPPSAQDYSFAGLPWFDYYDDNLKALPGASKLAGLKSVQKLSQKNGEPIQNQAVEKLSVINLKPGVVREGDF